MGKTAKLCARCYEWVTNPVTVTPGSFLVELFLWCMCLLPGLAYSMWRISNRRRTCRCGSTELVEHTSVMGTRILATRRAAGRVP